MLYELDHEDSRQYQQNPRSWAACAIEERTLQDLWLRGIEEPVAVVIHDHSSVAFYCAEGQIVEEL